MNDVTKFEYAEMPTADQVAVRAAAERIRVRMKRTVEDIIAIGSDLLTVKARLPHGEFLPWVEVEFGMSDQTARNFMNVAQRYSDKSKTVLDLSPRVLYELAAPSTPEPIRQAVEAKAKAGESISVVEVQRLKREAAGANRRAKDAEAEAERQKGKADTLAEGQRDLIERAKSEAQIEARAKVAAELEQVKADAKRTLDDLEAERRKLPEISRKAEAAAMEKAQAEAENLAVVELEKVQGAALAAKADEAKSREAIKRLSENAERLRKKAEEHDAFLRARTNGEQEAKNVRAHLEEINKALALAMVDLTDLEHEPPEDIRRLMAKSTRHCRDFAVALDQFDGPVLVYDAEAVQQ